MVHNKKPDRNAKIIEMAGKRDEAGNPLYTYDEIAEFFGITRQRVQQILKAESVDFRQPAKSTAKLLQYSEGTCLKLAR